MSTLEVRYRLPVSTVTITGRSTLTRNPVAEPKEQTVREAAVAVEIVADPVLEHTLIVPEPAQATVSTTVEVAPDGRLTGVSTTVTQRTGERLKAALQTGLFALGASAPFLAPLGPLGAVGSIALAAVGATVAAVSTSAGPTLLGIDRSSLRASRPPAAPAPGEELPGRPAATQLGVHQRYLDQHPADAEILADLIWSEQILRIQLSRAAPHLDADTVRERSASLWVVRSELDRARGQYTAWVQEQTTVVRTEEVREVFTLDELPTSTQLRQWAKGGFRAGDARWALPFKDLRLAISCDLDQPGATSASTSSTTGPQVLYRRPLLATLTTWRLERNEAMDYVLTVDSVERKVVVLRGTETTVPLRHAHRDEITTSLEFDGDGLLSSITSGSTDRSVTRAQSIGALPGLAGAAAAAGTAVTTPWAPTPVDPLLEQVQQAELEARLAAAQAVKGDPTRGLYVFTSVLPG